MTDPNKLIQEATIICEAATPGPWEVHHWTRGIQTVPSAGGSRVNVCQLSIPVTATKPSYRYGDAQFIATARTLVEQLAEALKTRIAEVLVSDAWISAFAKDYATLEMRAERLKAENEARTRERDEARAEVESLNLQVQNYEKATDLFTRDT